MVDLPPLNSLRAFDAAGRRQNFRAAAEDLGVTQGAVAQHVRQLEVHLGITLFERLPRGLEFTQAGRIYHNRVAEAFASLRAATAELTPQQDRVVISVTPTFAAKWLIPNLAQFAEAHPLIDLRIMATEKISSFHSDGIDLAVRQGRPPFGAALQATLLFRQNLIPVAAPALLQSAAGSQDACFLAQAAKIHDPHDYWPGYMAERGVRGQTQRGLRLSQTTLAVDAAIAGQGVALVSRFLVARDLNAGRLVSVGPEWIVEGQNFYLLAERSAKNRTAQSAVAEWLMSRSAAEHCA